MDEYDSLMLSPPYFVMELSYHTDAYRIKDVITKKYSECIINTTNERIYAFDTELVISETMNQYKNIVNAFEVLDCRRVTEMSNRVLIGRRGENAIWMVVRVCKYTPKSDEALQEKYSWAPKSDEALQEKYSWTSV